MICNLAIFFYMLSVPQLSAMDVCCGWDVWFAAIAGAASFLPSPFCSPISILVGSLFAFYPPRVQPNDYVGVLTPRVGAGLDAMSSMAPAGSVSFAAAGMDIPLRALILDDSPFAGTGGWEIGWPAAKKGGIGAPSAGGGGWANGWVRSTGVVLWSFLPTTNALFGSSANPSLPFPFARGPF